MSPEPIAALPPELPNLVPPSRPGRSRLWGWIVPLPPAGGSGPAHVLRWLALRILLFYGLICLMLGSLQRSMIYHPYRAASISTAEAGRPPGNVHDVTIDSPAGTLHGWHMLPTGESAATIEEADRLLADARVVVLYFSGNAGNRAVRGDLMALHADLGAHVILFDYRGYGENPGSPSESALVEDAHAAWRLLTVKCGIPARKIVLYGESLGGGVATRLAGDLSRSGTPPGALVVTATFSSLADAAAWHFPWLPVRWLLLDTYRSDRAIRDVTCPLLAFHGTLDSIVPLVLGRALFDAAPEASVAGVAKQFVELKTANHNDIALLGSRRIRAELRKLFDRL